MRYRKRALTARRNKILPITFVRQDMTTYSGLSLVDHCLGLYRIHSRIRQSFRSYGFKGDYSVADILYVVLIVLLLGAERLHHIDFIRDDPLFKRVVRLTRIPHRTTVTRALKQFTSDSLKVLSELNSALVIEKLTQLGLREITVDIDGTVVSTKGNPSWAFKGYNPVRKGAKSYYPLTSHIAETGHFLSIVNRPGDVHDSNRALCVIRAIRMQLSDFVIRFRADSAFCSPDVIDYLLHNRISFAIKTPFWKLLNLKTAAENRQRWSRISKHWGYFWIKNPIDSVKHDHYVIILRKKLKDLKKPYQLELFSPNNGYYEYSAIVTDNKQWDPEDLLQFVSGRSAQEHSISELKDSFAFDHIPSNQYQANSAYMQMSQMAYNLATSMQHDMGLVKKREKNKKKTRVFKTMEWKTIRFLLINRAGRISCVDGKKVLQMTENKKTKQLYERISDALCHMEYSKAA